ncbi:Acg family FMN-binding oxidoreductase [Mycobacterium sp. Lab-001]|uniref:Acg family FMN-binding oxidoreductase n=1 Tax=Mycobacterium sp. Lab-001 TaxID=3410136 RepID=UPI003D180CF8
MTRTTVDTMVITRAVELACRAPSLHNSQPWRWVAGGAVVDLFADPHRIVTATDGSGRESIISCGAVLDHFRDAMLAAGWDSGVDQFPNPGNLDHLASIDFAAADYVTDAQRERAAAIARRRTDRRPFDAPRDWASFEPALRSAFDPRLATLDVLADEARPRLVEASRLTEVLRRYDDLYHHELRWWTAPLRESEGIPESALPSEAQGSDVDVNRRFPANGQAEQGPAVHDQATIVVLSGYGDTRADWLDCGQALSAVLLECTMAGLATCTVTHITEVQAGRDIVRELLPDTTVVPQVLIRVGPEPAGEPPEPTPRRPLDDVLHLRN